MKSIHNLIQRCKNTHMHSFSHSIPFPGFAFAYIHLPLWSLAIAQDMGSSYFGEPNFGNERASCSSSSRKGKKSHNSDKPKQPQRGLGVAQLEKIRLHGYHPSLHAPYPSNFSNVNLSILFFNFFLSIKQNNSFS